MKRITCACTGCVEQLSNPWLSDLDRTLQSRYSIEPESCKYSSILHGYIKWYTEKLTLKKSANPDEMEIKYELFLNGMTWSAAEDIEYNNIGALKTSDSTTPGYYIV